MSRATRFAVSLVLGLAVVNWNGSALVERTTRARFERDVNLRALLETGTPDGQRRARLGEDRRE